MRMLCSTSFSHSTCARPSLCVGLQRAVRIASTKLDDSSLSLRLGLGYAEGLRNQVGEAIILSDKELPYYVHQIAA
jgi:hypothetical protein